MRGPGGQSPAGGSGETAQEDRLRPALPAARRGLLRSGPNTVSQFTVALEALVTEHGERTLIYW